MRRILGLVPSPRAHWVGDGFPVRSMFSHPVDAEQVSPFLLLDYAAPHAFAPADLPRGVGQHPHLASRRSPSSTKGSSSTATPRAAADASGPATCSG